MIVLGIDEINLPCSTPGVPRHEKVTRKFLRLYYRHKWICTKSELSSVEYVFEELNLYRAGVGVGVGVI